MFGVLSALTSIRLIVWASMAWSFVALAVVGFPLWSGASQSSRSPSNFIFGAGYIVTFLVIMLLHIVALRAASKSPAGRWASLTLMICSGSIFLVALITGFTVGLYVIPSAILLLIASLLSVGSNRI